MELEPRLLFGARAMKGMDGSLIPLLRRVCAFFDLGPLVHARDAGGYANQNLVIETGAGAYLARILREHGPEALSSEARYLEHVASAGFPCPRYRTGGDGAILFEGDGLKVALMPCIAGEISENPSPAQIGSVSAALAELHMIDTGSLMPRRTWWRDDFLSTNLASAKQRYGDQALARLEARITALMDFESEKLPGSIVHGDPWPGNALFDGDRLTALIDWEETTLGPSILDLAYLALHGCVSGGHVEPRNFRSLIESYQTVRRLSPHECRCFGPAVRWVACINYLWLIRKAEPDQGDLETLWASEWYWGLPLDRLAMA